MRYGLASLRELPDVDRLEDEGLLQRLRVDGDLDGAVGLTIDDERIFVDELGLDAAGWSLKIRTRACSPGRTGALMALQSGTAGDFKKRLIAYRHFRRSPLRFLGFVPQDGL